MRPLSASPILASAGMSPRRLFPAGASDFPEDRPLSLGRLTTLAQSAAGAPHLWRPLVRHAPLERWYCRLYRGTHYEVWLLGWEVEQDTDIHDHGGSSGAFCVAEGTLAEYHTDELRSGALTRTEHEAGSTRAFDGACVHNLRNEGPGIASSLHAYSPPLTTMNYYTGGRSGVLERVRTLQVDGPEPGRTELHPEPHTLGNVG